MEVKDLNIDVPELSFAIDLRDSEVVEENAFTQVVDEVKEVTNLPGWVCIIDSTLKCLTIYRAG